MWTTQASAVTKGSPEDVWRLWADVGTWPKWDDGIEWCRMDGPFREGSRGEMKPKGGPKVKFQRSWPPSPTGASATAASLPLDPPPSSPTPSNRSRKGRASRTRSGASAGPCRFCSRRRRGIEDRHRPPRRRAAAGRTWPGSAARSPGVAAHGAQATEAPESRYAGPSESPGFALWRVSNAWQRAIRAALAPYDLTHAQFVLLAATAWASVNREEPLSQRMLSDATGVDPHDHLCRWCACSSARA